MASSLDAKIKVGNIKFYAPQNGEPWEVLPVLLKIVKSSKSVGEIVNKLAEKYNLLKSNSRVSYEYEIVYGEESTKIIVRDITITLSKDRVQVCQSYDNLNIKKIVGDVWGLILSSTHK